MKKLMVLAIMISMVMGFSFAALAQNLGTAEIDVGMRVGVAGELGIMSDHFKYTGLDHPVEGEAPIVGLFNVENMITGQPGFYVSDGTSTVALAAQYFDRPATDLVQPLDVQDAHRTEVIVVAGNNNLQLTMSSDFDGWAPYNTFFHLASSDDMSSIYEFTEGLTPTLDVLENPFDVLDVDHYNFSQLGRAAANEQWKNDLIERGNLSMDTFNVLGDAEGWGNWATDLGYISNFAIDGESEAQGSVTVDIPFKHCTPRMMTLNGAIELDKLTLGLLGDEGEVLQDEDGNDLGVGGEEFSTIIEFTIAAQ